MNIENILQRLAVLEAHNEIRNTLNRYMEICDVLDQNTDLTQLMDLFDEQAIWEGIGARYSQSFGRYEGKDEIHLMFQGYTKKESHFLMNAHFVNSEQIDFQGDVAYGRWLMLQTSTFRDGKAHLNAAKLTIKFQKQGNGQWKMLHFQTANLFSRPVSHWDSADALPVPSND